jgi:hypothetical protein
LTHAQIRAYLGKALKRSDATQLMDTLGAVHGLDDLATHPYMLSTFAAQIPDIEQLQAERRPVHVATIYGQVVRDWLLRDQGKHRVKPDHKLTLMTRLAGWSWRRGLWLLDSTQLDDWLTDQLATDPMLNRRYEGVSRDQLEADLRTTTFLVRSDIGSGLSDFRFARDCLQEYFLAQYLCEALWEHRMDDWRMPTPTPNTLNLLSQLMVGDYQRAVLIAELGRLGWPCPMFDR